MLMHKKNYVMTGEVSPDIGIRNVWDYIQEKFANKEYFDILVPEHEELSYIWMQNIFVLGKYENGDAVIQSEPVLLCFDSQSLYTNQNNAYPEEVTFNRVAEIYSYERLKEVGYPIIVGIPTSLPTEYSDHI